MKKLLVLLALLAPLTAFATEDDAKDVCIYLITNITRNYDVSNLDLIPDGYNASGYKGSPAINCMYSAVTPKGTSVIVYATLYTATNKLSVEII